MISLRNLWIVRIALICFIVFNPDFINFSVFANTSNSAITHSKNSHSHSREPINLAGSWRYLPYEGPEDLSSPDFPDQGWPTMRLPSNWFLLGNSSYPAKLTSQSYPPYLKEETGALWPIEPDKGLDYTGTVWFRRHFSWLPQHQSSNAKLSILDLDMTDYFAEVYVNGVKTGMHTGYFQKWGVDITPYLHPGSNTIALKISAPPMIFDMSQQYPIGWPFNQNQIKGVFACHDSRPGSVTRRGQERSTGGLIGGIQIRPSTGIEMSEQSVTPLNVSAASARLSIAIQIRNRLRKAIPVILQGDILPKNFNPDVLQSNLSKPSQTIHLSHKLTLQPGENISRFTVTLQHPALWWSWDYGKPNLYLFQSRLVSEIVPATGQRRPKDNLKNNTTSHLPGPFLFDRQTTTFGIRSITHDDHWVWYLNGKRIYPRGTNYISTQWLSQADKNWYTRDLRLMREAHLNSVRVHAHVERPEFYNLADEMGLMVWQDFPLQWSYTDLPTFQTEAIRQLQDMIRQLYNHPAIIVWCMHNESPHALSWIGKHNPNQNLDLDNALAKTARVLDPVRVIHRDSGTGDGHPYAGWFYGDIADYARLDSEDPKDSPVKERFITEYGAEALPNLETLQTIFPEKHLWPQAQENWEQWKFADFDAESTFKRAHIRQGRNIQEFIENSQKYQANLIRYATECFRRSKWKNNTGLYQFMFAEDWPSIHAGVLDYYRRPKQGYFALKTAMQPVLPSISYAIHDTRQPIALFVINDLLQSFPDAVLKWRLVNEAAPESSSEIQTTGKIPEETSLGETHAVKVQIPPDSVVLVLTMKLPSEIAAGKARLNVWIEDKFGKRLGENLLSRENFILEPTNPH